MSASNKKKLRQEQRNAYLTEKQQAEAKEAKKLKAYTITFWVVMALCLSIVVSTVLSNPVKNVLFANTTAVNVGEHELSSVELNYYYIDAVNEFYSQNSYYISLMLDVSKPLSSQVFDKETGETWADYFVDAAEKTIKSTYALCKLANEKGHKLTEDEKKSVDSAISMMDLYAMYYGYNSTDAYLRGIYGNGATVESYRNYYEMGLLADSYYAAYSDSLDYTDAEIREYESKDNRYDNYSSLTYATYYIPYSKWAPTKDDNNQTIKYTDEQLEAARAEAKKAAEGLAAGTYEDLDAFDKAIAALEFNKDQKTGITCTRNEDQRYSSISNTEIKNWLMEADRKEGDLTVIANTSGEGDNKVINGYYVVRYGSINENKFALKDVRHLLVKFEGGKTNSTTGVTTYTDAEKKKALDEAEKLYKQWKDGAKTEDSFAELANKESDDGDGTTGGLYEYIYPGQMVEAFENWCYDEARKAGDTEIIETEYGYHIMYFVGDSDLTYRDYMIKNNMRSEELNEWLEDLIEKQECTIVTDKHVNKDLILSSH